MFKKSICVIAAVIGLASCDKTGKVETTPTGLKYIFYKRDEKGRKAKPGEIITMNFAFKTSKDSVLRSTFKDQGPIQIPLQPSPFKGSLEEGLTMVSPGDSVTFYVKADSLFAKSFNQPLPPFIAKGSDVAFLIKVEKIQSQEELQKARETDAVKQKETDAKKIAEYEAKNNLTNVQKTSSGLNYIITQEGTGKQASRGDSVSVHYVLKTLDGKVLESSHENPRNNNQPFTFPLGMGMVIPGWDEGITLFKKGGKGTLIVPSGLAYGPDSRPGMPGNSILVFDIELVDVK